MPLLFIFLLKVNIALLIFCAGYYFVLRRLTFYTLNRIYLVMAILFASIYPKINLSTFLERHQQIAKPVQAVAFTFRAPATALMRPLEKTDYWAWAETIFWVGSALFALRLLVQFISLFRIYRSSTATRIHNHDVRVIKGNAGPFSFWKSIYVNPEMHSPTDLKSILLHEQVHVSEWHTLDIILAELSTIFYWFNPGVWLMKKAIRENIEFITDRKILKNGIDSKQYQYSLVIVSFAATPYGIVNHFNISTIKKRIIMMNAKRSSKIYLTRYALLVPAVVALLLVFSISKAAFVKKNAPANKPSSIKVSAGTLSMVKNDIVHLSDNLINKVKKGIKTADTIKKGNFYIATSHHSDSLNYVINGVKASKADFKAIDSNRIYSIEMMPAKQASKITDQIDNKNDVLFVTTDDSEPGKKFKEKLDKLNGIANADNNIVAIGKGNNVAAIAGDGIVATNISTDDDGDGSGTTTVTSNSPWAASAGIKVKLPRKAYKIRTKTFLVRDKADTLLTLNSRPFTTKFYGADSGRYVYTNVSKSKIYTFKSKYKVAPFKNSYKYHTGVFPKVYTLNSSDADDETNIEHLSEKMIMIDGKEASSADLKKLSAADIENMSVKSGDDITKKYGDKAKNGVVFIETRKK